MFGRHLEEVDRCYGVVANERRNGDGGEEVVFGVKASATLGIVCAQRQRYATGHPSQAQAMADGRPTARRLPYWRGMR